MPLTLTFRGSDRQPVSVEGIVPVRLQGLTSAAIERLPLRHGNRQTSLAELFKVSGKFEDARIHFVGDLTSVDDLGKGLDRGMLTIEGHAGRWVGSAMTGGQIDLHGNAGDFTGCAMRGGQIHIRGNVGHQAGGSVPGSRRSMTGGNLIIRGNAGNEIGRSMRRGLIAVGGNCGNFAGVGMLAGSMLLFGDCGQGLGAEMRRGTIVLFGKGVTKLLPTFSLACRFSPPVIPLLISQLAGAGFPSEPTARQQFDLYQGDWLSLGRGEILVSVS